MLQTALESSPLPFDNSYARLSANFFARLDPVPVSSPRLIKFNERLAGELGLDTTHLDGAALAAIFSGNLLPKGAEPLAMAYAGHQFGQFVPQLGDGRAILLGEVHRPARSAPRHPAQGRRPDALLARWRWARRLGTRTARVSGQRGHACPGDRNDTVARGGYDR